MHPRGCFEFVMFWNLEGRYAVMASRKGMEGRAGKTRQGSAPRGQRPARAIGRDMASPKCSAGAAELSSGACGLAVPPKITLFLNDIRVPSLIPGE